MIVSRLRSEARGGSSSGSSTRYSGSVYGGKLHHGQQANDPDLKRALQYSYTLQAVKKWEKRWVVIHETSMRVHKWMIAPVATSIPASQTIVDNTANITKNNTERQQKETTIQQNQQESVTNETQNTQIMMVEESIIQSSQD
ncbi:unnamed protein product [Rotaria magnacalcarata]|uniref:Uncharacterized protein n=1 Tax=Rotaria magnacalcarata TaxID=392030 RepID=A0A816KE96_9BILA|nr:unnamed protein product [Rotaria magnacalcarata]CAF1919555.1 unnamed protein product [Rotaria magnacalcarata]CAF3811032.1 unnamed protein product [Rotaria magnacalcarata]